MEILESGKMRETDEEVAKKLRIVLLFVGGVTSIGFIRWLLLVTGVV